MTFWRVASKARSVRVAIEGSLSGCSAFLVGGSSRLLELDLRLLKLPGIWTMAINNAATVVEPDAFIALDSARCFNPNIFSNPRVMKLFSYSRHDDMISGKRLCLYPNTLFFDLQDETQLMMTEFCRLSGPLPYWKVTFFTALAALYQLGIKRVNLIGCTFDVPGYAHNVPISSDDQAYNDEVHRETVKYLSVLLPLLKDEGMEVRTCHQNTALDGICEYIDYNQAVGDISVESTSLRFNRLQHKSKIDK